MWGELSNYFSYHYGYELLMINGALTYLGLRVIKAWALMPPMQGTDLQRIYNGIITDLQRSSRNWHHLSHNTHHPIDEWPRALHLARSQKCVSAQRLAHVLRFDECKVTTNFFGTERNAWEKHIRFKKCSFYGCNVLILRLIFSEGDWDNPQSNI